MAAPEVSSQVPKRRLVVFYAALAAVAGLAATVVISAGSDRQAQKRIAGGYDVIKGRVCLGPKADVRQSGQFVSLESPDGSLSGRLRFEHGRLTGEVGCVDGRSARIDAGVRRGRLSGTLAGRPLEAEFKRDPPDAGTLRARAPGSVDGEYRLTPRSECLGGRLELDGGELVAGAARGELAYRDGKLEGPVECARGGRAELAGEAAGRQIALTLVPAPRARSTVAGTRPASPEPAAEKLSAQKVREFGHTLAAFFVAVVVVMLSARLAGAAIVRLGQPRVMGEVSAGILLGPTVLGAALPGVQDTIFPSDIVPFIGVVANLGLIFYMFLVGLELDIGQLKGRVTQTAAISNSGVLVPMTLGLLIALPIYELVGPDTKFAGFALFMGVSMSITAFPVLARILVERRMLKRPVGALALACAAVDDVTAWFLIALATAVAVAGSGSEVVQTVALAIGFCLLMAFVVRPLIGRASVAFDEAGRVPTGWITAIFAGVLLSAWTTETIGIALIFGAFIMGAIMPRHAGLTEDVTHRVEDFVVTLLLPLFFAYTGLRTNIGLLDRPELVLITLALIVVAVLCKFGGTLLAARITGLGWRASAVIGTLMNTRGLTELIVLNLALEKGVISEALFAMLVLMALVTTFMAGPVLRLLDPTNSFGAPVEEELAEARRRSAVDSPVPIPSQSILLAPQTDTGLEQLRSLAEPLALSVPPRELILARLVRPPRGAAVRGGLQTEDRILAEASDEVNRARKELLDGGIAARAVAFSSVDPGQDLSKLAQSEEVDLVMVDGARPLLGAGVPRGDVGTILGRAPCDVGVLVAREGERVVPGPEAAVIVPFGGAEHDWAALELGAWIATSNGAPLKLLGAAGQTEEGGDAGRLLANASLVVQQFAGIPSEPLIAEPGRAGILAAAAGAGLLVIGLSDRWREEGLGPTRSDIARAAPAPILFVRRGQRPGALAPRENVTRFTWSSPGIGLPRFPG